MFISFNSVVIYLKSLSLCADTKLIFGRFILNFTVSHQNIILNLTNFVENSHPRYQTFNSRYVPNNMFRTYLVELLGMNINDFYYCNIFSKIYDYISIYSVNMLTSPIFVEKKGG